MEYGCDVNAQDSDGWTPLHCAASCNNLEMVKFLVESGACLFAATLSDHETPAEKCEEDEEGFDGCSEYLYSEYSYYMHKCAYRILFLPRRTFRPTLIGTYNINQIFDVHY